jgi:hypothetical protein
MAAQQTTCCSVVYSQQHVNHIFLVSLGSSNAVPYKQYVGFFSWQQHRRIFTAGFSLGSSVE